MGGGSRRCVHLFQFLFCLFTFSFFSLLIFLFPLRFNNICVIFRTFLNAMNTRLPFPTRHFIMSTAPTFTVTCLILMFLILIGIMCRFNRCVEYLNIYVTNVHFHSRSVFCRFKSCLSRNNIVIEKYAGTVIWLVQPRTIKFDLVPLLPIWPYL